MTDLLRSSTRCPSARPSDARDDGPPRHARTWNRPALGIGDRSAEPIVDVSSQLVVGGELRGFGIPRTPSGMLLRDRGPVLQTATASGGVAVDFT
jgi:hypothetical protein